MPNKYYANFHDIWKHLPLAEVLSSEHIQQYWETHSGSCLYQVELNLSRKHGVNYYLENLNTAPLSLQNSTYSNLLKSINPIQTDSKRMLNKYSGSPYIALATLRDHSKYIFCDIDPVSLTSISNDINQYFPELKSNVSLHQSDGIQTILDNFKSLTNNESVFTFIDPYNIFNKSTGNCNFDCLQLFGEMCVHENMKLMLWYGLSNNEQQRNQCKQFQELLDSVNKKNTKY